MREVLKSSDQAGIYKRTMAVYSSMYAISRILIDTGENITVLINTSRT